MRINSYSFGKITIDDTQYKSDLMIIPEDGGHRVVAGWRRESGHLLTIDDVAEILATNPTHLIVGTGASEGLEIDPALKDHLKEAGIRLIAEPSDRAASTFHAITSPRKAAAFHLTC